MSRLIAALVVVLVAAGCACAPAVAPGSSTVVVHVSAAPRAGYHEPLARVTTYDAAPAHAVAAGQFEHVDYAHLKNIIVYLEATNSNFKVHDVAPLRLNVDPKRPTSDIAPASIGQAIHFHNNTGAPLNLYSVSEGNEFDFAAVAPNADATFTAKSEGLIELLSDPAKPPIARVYVAPSPFAVRTSANQTVTFMKVSPGAYTVWAWHPRLPAASTAITTTLGEVTATSLNVGVNNLAH